MFWIGSRFVLFFCCLSHLSIRPAATISRWLAATRWCRLMSSCLGYTQMEVVPQLAELSKFPTHARAHILTHANCTNANTWIVFVSLCFSARRWFNLGDDVFLLIAVTPCHCSDVWQVVSLSCFRQQRSQGLSSYSAASVHILFFFFFSLLNQPFSLLCPNLNQDLAQSLTPDLLFVLFSITFFLEAMIWQRGVLLLGLAQIRLTIKEQNIFFSYPQK